jgi:hypothetical protein
MSPRAAVHERLYRVFSDVGDRLRLPGPDPALELAGRFGVRRFVQRHVTSDEGLRPSPWLVHGARLRKEARNISRALSKADVRHCFFKGIALLGRFYHIDERRLADVDLLVDLAHANKAMAALHQEGYDELGDRKAWRPAADRPGVTMYQPESVQMDGTPDVLLDLHWGLESLGTLLPDEEIVLPPSVWERVGDEQGLPVLPDEEHAALVLHHLVRHDLLHVRGLLDFALLWEALPQNAGAQLSALADTLGVSRALRVVGRVLVDELHLYPLRGVRLGPRDWRDRLALRNLRLRPWLMWAARHVGEATRHVVVTRSLAWRRIQLADTPHPGRLLRDLVLPPREYLRWRWPNLPSGGAAWRRHVATALRA